MKLLGMMKKMFGDEKRANQVMPTSQSPSPLQLRCKKELEDKEAMSWKFVEKSFSVYVPPMAGLFQGSPGSDLMDHLEVFLKTDYQKVLLLQGDSGAGKSTFARFLYHQFFLEKADYLPIFIPLPRVGTQFEQYFKKVFAKLKQEVDALKETQRFLFIMDGFDELAEHVNLYTINELFEWEHAKCLITCRSQYLNQWTDYVCNFEATDPMGLPLQGSLMELYLTPFDETQRKTYLKKVEKAPGWDIARYEQAMQTVPIEMQSNPFLLSTLVEFLPQIQEEHKEGMLKRSQIYATMISHRLEMDVTRMKGSTNLKKTYTTTELKTFSTDLALVLWKQNKITFDLTMKSFPPFANQDAEDILNLLARKGCLLKHVDPHLDCQNSADDNDNVPGTFEFIHKSVLEYMVAGYLFNALSRSNIDNTDFTHCYLSEHPAVVDFIVEMLWSKTDEVRKQLTGNLFNLIERSKSTETDDNDDDELSCDAQTIKASSNAATILARAGIGFSGRDLRKVRLDHANLNGGLFHHVNLQGACLRKATLQRVQLLHTNLKSADLTEVEFGEMLTMRAKDSINCIAHHPKKDECAAGLENGNIIIWDSKQAQVLRTLIGHKMEVTSVCYSPSGDRILSGSNDNTVRQWSSLGGAATHIFKGHEEVITSVCYSPSGDRILSGSYDMTVRQWSSLGGAATHIFKGHEEVITSVCYSPSGDRILSGSDDKTVRQWPCLGGSATHIFKGHESLVTSVCYSPSGDRILSGSGDWTVRQWPSLGGAATHIFNGHEKLVTSVCYSPSGDRILSGSMDKTVRQWSSLGGVATHIFKGHESWVSSVCYSPKGDRILSGSYDRTVRQWSSIGGSATHIFKGHEAQVTSVCYSPSGDRILSGSYDRTVRQWSSLGGAVTHIFEGHEGRVRSVCYSPSGDRILSGCWVTVRQWPSLGGFATHIFTGHEYWVTSVCYSPSGDRILSGSYDKTVRQWSSSGGAAYHIFKGHENQVTSVCYSPLGDRILSGSGDETVRQWSSLGGAATHIFKGHEDWVTSVCFCPSGDRILSGSYDNTVRQWSSLGGSATHIFKGHEMPVTSVCYNPSGDRILSGSRDKTARIWEVIQTSEKSNSQIIAKSLSVLRGHHSTVRCVAWSKQNQIVTGSDDKAIAVWKNLDRGDDGEVWAMVWRSGYTPIIAFGCLIDDHTNLSLSNRALIEERSIEEKK